MRETVQSGDGSEFEPSRFDESDEAGSSRRLRPRIQVQALVVLLIGVAVVVLGWQIIWEGKHPAAATARKIQQGDAGGRLAVIHELEDLGRVNPEVAIPALVIGLEDPDATVRAAAAVGLVSAANGAATVEAAYGEVRNAVDALIRTSKDEQTGVRAAAVQSLWMLASTWSGPEGLIDQPRVLDILVGAAGDADAGVRLAALRGIGTVGPRIVEAPPTVLVAALEDTSELNRAAAAYALAHFRRGLPPLVPALMRSLETTRPEIRPQYREVLGAIRAPQFSAEAVPALIAILGSADAEVRTVVAWSLGTFKDKARPAIPALIQSLSDSRGTSPAGPQPTDEELMTLAVNSPGLFVEPPIEPAPSSQDAVIEAAKTLGRLAPRTEQAGAAIAALAKVLRSGSTPRRVAAAKALARFPSGPLLRRPPSLPEVHADPVQIAALTAALSDPETPVRVAALRGFHDVGMQTRFETSSELNSAIAKALEDPVPEVRSQAAGAICHYGDIADRFFPALVRHADRDPDQAVRDMCDEAVAPSGSNPARVTEAIIPVLIEALASRENTLRRAACQSLDRFGPAAVAAVPALIRVVEDPSERESGMDDRAAAAETLGRLAPGTPQAAEAIAALTKLLRPEATGLQMAVASALARFGPKAAGAIPQLRELAKLPNAPVSETARKALGVIEGSP